MTPPDKHEESMNLELERLRKNEVFRAKTSSVARLFFSGTLLYTAFIIGGWQSIVFYVTGVVSTVVSLVELRNAFKVPPSSTFDRDMTITPCSVVLTDDEARHGWSVRNTKPDNTGMWVKTIDLNSVKSVTLRFDDDTDKKGGDE